MGEHVLWLCAGLRLLATGSEMRVRAATRLAASPGIPLLARGLAVFAVEMSLRSPDSPAPTQLGMAGPELPVTTLTFEVC